MAVNTIEIRDVGDEVFVVSNKGVEKGTVGLRELTNDNKIRYSVKVPSHRNYTRRFSDEVFDTVDQLLTYYKNLYNEV